jgi:spore coat protein CotH
VPKPVSHAFRIALLLTLAAAISPCIAQPPPEGDGEPPRFGPMRGPGGGGMGPMGQERKLVKQFDTDGDGKLNTAERAAARELLKRDKANRPNRMMGPGGAAGAGGPGGDEKPSPGPRVSPSDVKAASGDLYDAAVLRTIFLDFESPEWESEMEDFYNTDVEVPATMTVDGKVYQGVGVHFRGASSFFGVRAGSKRSLNVSVDFTDEKQSLKTAAAGGKEHGYTTLNLLNSHEDPSFMSTVLYSTIANRYIPTPRANFVRVVINGESWGVYVNVEQFNKDFIKRNFKGADGKKAKGEGHEARWKVKGSPGARSGLEYTGDDLKTYKQRYQIKSSDRDEDWQDLINLCKVLNTTPAEKLEAALKPILDVDATLKFLALDVVLANGDGYWTRASDYSIYKDATGVFHIVPHDMNECFQATLMGPPGGMGPPRGREPGGVRGPRPGGEGEAGGPPNNEPPTSQRPQEDGRPGGGADGAGGMRRMRGPGAGRSGTELDPLVGLDDATKPLRSKLLAVPALRERYLGYVKQIAERDLDWASLGGIVKANRAVIEEALAVDTRKLTSLQAFKQATGDEVPGAAASGRPQMSLRGFADKRRAYLMNYAPKQTAATEKEANR